MGERPDCHELARRLAVLEERMNTKQAEYRSDVADLMREISRAIADNHKQIAEIHKQIAVAVAETQKQIADTNAEMQKQLATATERMATTRWWETAVLLGGMGIAAAVIIAAVAAVA